MPLRKALANQRVVFIFGLLCFLMCAVIGWKKLKYGFCFLDEGYHMTESWRLAAGDNFLKDKLTGANSLYVLINSLVFRASPNITLLGFRRLEYFLTMFSLLLFSISLFRVDRQYWYQPFIFSLFAFTGLDPGGWISNLSYHTYPHLFVTLHLSFLILGLYQKNRMAKRVMYVSSGFFMWMISLTLLHLSVIVFSPILLFLVSRKLEVKTFSFKFEDLCYVLAPFALCWALFIGIYNKSYLLSIYRSISMNLGIPGHTPQDLVHVNWEALKHIGVSGLVLLIGISCFKKLRLSIFLSCLIVISTLMFFIIDTSFFGLINPYKNGWFSRPMWFCSFLISFVVVFLFDIVRKCWTGHDYNAGEELAITLVIPCVILYLSTSFFSVGGPGMLLYYSIPTVAAITNVVLYNKRIHTKAYSIKLLILIALFLPFYYTTAWSDWRSTFFDVFPEQANVTIGEGFGKGIKTNRIYYNLYNWIRVNTKKYTKKDDFMISYVTSPMAHMVAKRRPALDDSFMLFTPTRMEYYKKCLELMKKRRRYPKIAFVFESMPAFYPLSLKGDAIVWFGKQFDFQSSKDPISRYVKENMRLVSVFRLYEGNIARCFVE